MKTKNLVIGGAVMAVGIGTALALHSRKSIPKGAVPVKPFNKNKYMGKWYEIARLDFRFEKGLNNTTAFYSINEDGSIKVVNSGYNPETDQVEQTVGKATFIGSPDEARLKVSFFGPFYSGYNVIAIDPDYKYALVAGKNLNYLWLLSRETSMPEDIMQSYLLKARNLGYDTSKLVWVEHDEYELIIEDVEIYM